MPRSRDTGPNKFSYRVTVKPCNRAFSGRRSRRVSLPKTSAIHTVQQCTLRCVFSIFYSNGKIIYPALRTTRTYKLYIYIYVYAYINIYLFVAKRPCKIIRKVKHRGVNFNRNFIRDLR